jgi:nucleoside-diphosphate-sugar epimerase
LLDELIPTEERTLSKTILVTGATGYVGGRLIRPLVEPGRRVRRMARRPRTCDLDRSATWSRVMLLTRIPFGVR